MFAIKYGTNTHTHTPAHAHAHLLKGRLLPMLIAILFVTVNAVLLSKSEMMPVPLSLIFLSILFCRSLCRSMLHARALMTTGRNIESKPQTVSTEHLNFHIIRVYTHARSSNHAFNMIRCICGVVNPALPLPTSSQSTYSVLYNIAHFLVCPSRCCRTQHVYLFLSLRVCIWMSYITISLHLFCFQTTSFVCA